jgi:hypothetical protein
MRSTVKGYNKYCTYLLPLGEVGRGLSCFLLFFLFACNSNTKPAEDNGHLPVSLVNNPNTANGMDTVAAARKPTMDFTDTLHDFGPIHQDEVVEHDFSFTNNGKSSLIIISAVGSCGCTVPDYPHDAVQPGKTAIMKVTFNSAGKMGHQEKSVTIHTNTLRNVHMLYIKADVSKKE